METHLRAISETYWITVLSATDRHTRVCPTLTQAMQADTRFTYPKGIKG